MHAIYTTLVGRVATAPEKQTYDSGSVRVSFRVGCTERRRTTHGWEDGERLFITVRCWRQLAENVHASFAVGDPVVAHGKIFTRNVDRDGSRLAITEMDAIAVGPDLRWATAVVTRTKAAAAGTPTGAPEAEPHDGLGRRADGPEESVPDDPWAALEAAAQATADAPGA